MIYYCSTITNKDRSCFYLEKVMGKLEKHLICNFYVLNKMPNCLSKHFSPVLISEKDDLFQIEKARIKNIYLLLLLTYSISFQDIVYTNFKFIKNMVSLINIGIVLFVMGT